MNILFMKNVEKSITSFEEHIKYPFMYSNYYFLIPLHIRGNDQIKLFDKLLNLPIDEESI